MKDVQKFVGQNNSSVTANIGLNKTDWRIYFVINYYASIYLIDYWFRISY
jgi:hypothetical protein